jgi:isoquinoline 1-oxidoreductase subunit beta
MTMAREMEIQTALSRRELLVKTAALGGGMAISLALPSLAQAVATQSKPGSKALANGAVELGPWIVIGADDSVIVRTSAPESGNGAMTQIVMTVTEELHCDWQKVRVECISPTRVVREKITFPPLNGLIDTFAGRSTTPQRMQAFLQLGASARERLKTAAAQTWNVPVAEIEAKNSTLIHKPSQRSLRFGDVASRAATTQLKSEPALKPQTEWTLLGKTSLPKLNNALVANGSAIYGMDVRLPEMLYAALMQSPVHGGKLKRYDFDVIKGMPGVRGIAVVDPDEPRKLLKKPISEGADRAQSAIAVVADHYWQARQALDKLPIEWDDGPGAQWKTTEQVNEHVLARLQRPGEKVLSNEGDTLKALEQGSRVIEATYLTPHCDQMVMEPLNGVACINKNRVEIWHGAAISMQSHLVAAEEAGVPAENVEFHQTLVGGSFGRRLYGDDIRMVVAIAKKFPGRPVKVIWSREETTRQGRYRHLTAGRFRAALDENGMPKALHTHISRPGYGLGGLDNAPYFNGGTISNTRIETSDVPLHIHWAAFRAPSYNSYIFFVESFIDECAAAAGIDPVEYRLRLLAKWPDAGWKKCLQEVATRSGWGKKLPRGQAQGVAISNWGSWAAKDKLHAGTTVATVAHVDVTREGALKVLQLDLAFDCGRMLNPDAVIAQMEGGTVFGLNLSLNEELNIQNGRIVEGNFDQYPMLHMADVPRVINVHFGGLSGHDRFSEVGEPPVGPVSAAIANAIYRATGKRVRSMPFRKHDLRWS